MTISEIQLFQDQEERYQFQDEDLSQRWQKFHHKKAIIQILPESEHLKKRLEDCLKSCFYPIIESEEKGNTYTDCLIVDWTDFKSKTLWQPIWLSELITKEFGDYPSVIKSYSIDIDSPVPLPLPFS